MSSAPTDPTQGRRVRIAAPKRSSVAGRTPPNRRSATSVVVMSRKPVSIPLSASFSIVRPPVPVAWKTRQSWLSRKAAVIAVTQGVVTPNIVSPMAGLPPLAVAGCSAMPAIASAALVRTTRLIRFSPARSVTAGIRIRSEMPT